MAAKRKVQRLRMLGSEVMRILVSMLHTDEKVLFNQLISDFHCLTFIHPWIDVIQLVLTL